MSLIKKIRIKNFKSLEDVEIEIKPLTFLFGPNSSGKSSFLKAMLFLSKNLFPLNTGKTIYKISDDVDLGSYKDIVANNDISKYISFEIEFEGTFLFPKKELILLDEYTEKALRGLNLYDDLFEGTRMEDALTKLNNSPFFNVIEDLINKVELDYGPHLNLFYEKLLERNSLNSIINVEFKYTDHGANLSNIKIIDTNYQSFIEIIYSDYDGYSVFSSNGTFVNLLNDKLITNLFSNLFEFPFNSKFKYPANFPTKNQFLNGLIDYVQDKTLMYFVSPPNEEWDKYDNLKRKNIYYELLKFIYISYRLIPNNLFRFLLIKHLPLTRINPKSKYIKENDKFISDDYYGILDIIKADQNKIIDDKVVHENDFNKTQIASLTQTDSIKGLRNKSGEVIKNIYMMSNHYLNLLFKLNYFLKCNEEVGRIFTISTNNTITNISASSSGFIQIFPIIMFCNLLNKNNFMFLKFGRKSFDVDDYYFLDRFFIYADNIEINDLVINYDNYSFENLGHDVCNKNFAQLYIEQPELHLHPKLQSQLAELFTDTIKDANKECLIVIETHSEHLIRKMQVLIAKGELEKEKVGVWYFDNNEGATKIKEMIIEPNGFFKEPWPNGFFDESYNLSKELLFPNKN